MDQQPAGAVDAAPPVPFQTDTLITAKEVARITGLSRKRVVAAAEAGYLTVYRPPAGIRSLVKYGSKSAHALARSMVTPATAPQTPPTKVP